MDKNGTKTCDSWQRMSHSVIWEERTGWLVFFFVTTAELLDTSSGVDEAHTTVTCVVGVAGSADLDFVAATCGACVVHSTTSARNFCFFVIWVDIGSHYHVLYVCQRLMIQFIFFIISDL